MGKKWNAILLYFTFGEAIANKYYPPPFFFKAGLTGSQIILFKIIFLHFLKTIRVLNNCLVVTVITSDKIYCYHLHHPERPLKTWSVKAKWHVTSLFMQQNAYLINTELFTRDSIVCDVGNTNQVRFVLRLFWDMTHPLTNVC